MTREVDDVSVILYQHSDEVTVMFGALPHQSGPLGRVEVQEINQAALWSPPGTASRSDSTVARW